MSSKNKLKIAILNRNFGEKFGGAERYSVSIAEELSKNHEVHIFAQDIQHESSNLKYHKVSCFFTKPRWLNQIWYALITWILTKNKFDIVHSHENTWHGNIQTVHVRPFRAGLFHHHRNGWRHFLKTISLLTSLRLLTYWILEWARLRPMKGRQIVSTSQTVSLELIENYPMVYEYLHTITPGVDLPQDYENKNELRAKFKLPELCSVALFIGNDYKKKGLEVLINAIALIPNVHLVVVGNPSKKSIYEQQANLLNVSDRVHFLGFWNDMSPIYLAADFLVHPTSEDSYAMVVLEAMAHGLPTIVSNYLYCGIAAELSNNKNSLILDNPNDHIQLSELISTLMQNKELYLKLKNEGIIFARNKNWECIAKKYEEIYSIAATSTN